MLYPIFESQILSKTGIQIKLNDEIIQVFRFENRWTLYHLPLAVDDPRVAEPTFKLVNEPPQQWMSSQQWVSGDQESTFRCFARMPGQSFIAFPAETLIIPKERKPKLYARIPLQLSFQIGQSKTPIWEGFFASVKQTWFGKNTRAGELAITQADSLLTTAPADDEAASFHVWMEVKINNRDQEPLLLDRVALPTPYFPVYQLDHRSYWTYPLSLTKERLLDELRVSHGKEISQRYEHKRLVGEAHQNLEVRTIMRALEAIIG